MDPQAAWQKLVEARADSDWDAVDEAATALLAWLDSGGFPPETAPGKQMGPRWNRAVTHAACLAALAERSWRCSR